ncbi:hypothetical protein DH2020_019201 [Rehmannia glutinosa]|uniref:Disease resistance N-terminal domain-containing protein n=1 Tax=Rehmannia glutinosa TaxID=99300 RepID=A0ABR0WPK5_REHGL
MAHVAVNFLLENLSHLLKSNVNFISGADQVELRQLQNDVGLLLEAFLREAANKKAAKEEMERQIKEVVYDIEDTIDSCLTATKGKSLLRYFNLNHASLAKEVRFLREDKLKPLVDKVIRMDFADIQIGHKSSTKESHMKSGKAAVQDLHVSRQDKFVGLEDEAETIVKYVMEAKDELDVISIASVCLAREDNIGMEDLSES